MSFVYKYKKHVFLKNKILKRCGDYRVLSPVWLRYGSGYDWVSFVSLVMDIFQTFHFR